MGELDVRSKIEERIQLAQTKITQKPECWTPGLANVGWETFYVPFGNATPGAAWDTVDFHIHFTNPVSGICLGLGAGLGGVTSPSAVGFSFNPMGIAVSALASPTTLPEPDLFSLNVEKLVLFEEIIQDIYISVGVPAGGPFTGAGYPNTVPVSGMRGFKAIYSLI